MLVPRDWPIAFFDVEYSDGPQSTNCSNCVTCDDWNEVFAPICGAPQFGSM
jgi:hypothetical protein